MVLSSVLDIAGDIVNYIIMIANQLGGFVSSR